MKTVYLSSMAVPPLIEYLDACGYNVNLLSNERSEAAVYQEIKCHADIYMCQLGLWTNTRIFMGETSKLQPKYPDDIIYNAVCTEQFFIHNLRYTDPELRSAVESLFPAINFINTRQGYTRCSCLPVDNNGFITGDYGLYKTLKNSSADVLLISPNGVSLPGFKTGFIGGCAGNLIIDGKKTIVFNGDLSVHPDYEKIAAYILDRNIDIKFFEGYPLTDIGSILATEE